MVRDPSNSSSLEQLVSNEFKATHLSLQATFLYSHDKTINRDSINSTPAGLAVGTAAVAPVWVFLEPASDDALEPLPTEPVFLPKPANVIRESFSSSGINNRHKYTQQLVDGNYRKNNTNPMALLTYCKIIMIRPVHVTTPPICF